VALLAVRRLWAEVKIGRAVGVLRWLVARAERGERLAVGETRRVLRFVQRQRPEVGGRDIGWQLEAIARATRQRSARAVGKGDHIFRALTRYLGDHPRTDRVVVGEEPDAGVEIEIAACGPPPRQVHRSARICGRAIGYGVDPAAIRIDAEAAPADRLLEADDAAHLVGGLSGPIEQML